MQPSPLTEIVPHLYLGSAQAASSKSLLDTFKITHIICCAEELTPVFPGEYLYLAVPMTNTLNKDAFPLFRQASTFIEEGISYGNVLVHCVNGVSRSATVVMAYLMEKNGHTPDEAKEFVTKKRPWVSNHTFMYMLYAFENELNEERMKKLIEMKKQSEEAKS